MLEITTLGGLSIKQDGRRVSELASRKAEALLVYIASVERPQPREVLAEMLWEERTQRQSLANLRVVLASLRKELEPYVRITRTMVSLEPEAEVWLDTAELETQLAAAHVPPADLTPEVTERIGQAAELYHGDFLDGFYIRDSTGFEDWMARERERLRRLVVDALCDLVAYELSVGEYKPGARRAAHLLEIDPLTEEAHGLLMQLLALSGQRSAALEQYETCRRLLERELGVEPAEATTWLYEQIQAGSLSAPFFTHVRTAAGREPVPITLIKAPFQAPPDIPDFVGREKEMADFEHALTSTEGQLVYCLAGMGGVGKTALAAHLAHVLRERFSDGVLWANASTSEPLAILDSWARAYDCDFSGLPDPESRAAAVRALLAEKKVLVVLDDVWDAGRVRSLLPSGDGCTVLLTTRDVEVGVALNAQIHRLLALSSAECLLMMSRIVGGDRVQEDAGAAGLICDLLGNLPLAVEIVSKRLASRPRWELGRMADRLGDTKNRLALRISDREVWTSFDVSWEALDEEARRTLALLAVFEGRSFTAAAVAAVAEKNTAKAEDSLHDLVLLSLVSEEGEVRYRQHPLAADFSREQLGDSDGPYHRMTSYYKEFAEQHEQDYAALEQEWDNLAAGLRAARRLGAWQLVIDFGAVLEGFWFTRARFSDARESFEWACEAAHSLGDHPALATSLCEWGRACIEQGDYDEAEEHLSESLRIWERLDDLHGVARAQYHLGRIALERGLHDEAEQLLDQSWQTRKRLGDVIGVAEALFQRAFIQLYRESYGEAERTFKQVLETQQDAGDKLGSLRTLRLLAHVVLLAKDDQDSATSYCARALELCEELDERGELASTHLMLSKIHMERGELELSRYYADRSMRLFRSMGDRKSQAQALYRLSLVDADLGDHATALKEGLQSVDLCREVRDGRGVVYVLCHLGGVLTELVRSDQARKTWLEALGIAEELPQVHPLTESLRELVSG
jgi:DNA-binding SARP family transcriptional activator/TolA-binding protein